MSKRPFSVLSSPDGDPTAIPDEMQISMLGGGCEVGRSCCVIRYKGATVVCDAGVHPAHTGIPSLPYVDELDWSTVDCILITHFHLDHAAGLPYIMEKTNFKDGGGRVYMTHPTKEAYGFLMQDFVRLSMTTSTSTANSKLFDEEDLQTSFASIHGVAFHEEVFVPARPSTSSTLSSSTSIRFMTYPAGHILGACMFLIEMGGSTILYTGDYSTEEDRHLIPASVPAGGWGSSGNRPDVMVCESTFGVQTLEPRVEKEERLTSTIRATLKQGGRVLIPIFAFGTAQELLLILDEYWSAHPDLHQYPVYYVSTLAIKGLRLYRSHTSSLNNNVQSRTSRGDNPFDFQKGRHVKELREPRRFDDRTPCVVLAAPGMLQSGFSRMLLEKWAPDKRNSLLLCGYSVEGTLARDMQKEPDEITSMEGKKIVRRMGVEYISFAAHVDYTQNSSFIDKVKPAHLVLVHGEQHNVNRLRSALKKHFTESKVDVQIYTPKNTELLKIRLARNRIGRAVGTLAETAPTEGLTLSALLVSKDAQYTLLLPSDLQEFTGLSTSSIIQRQHLKVGVSWELIRWHLEGLFGSVILGMDDEKRKTIRIMKAVDLKQISETELMLEWAGGSTHDMIADSVLALLFGINQSRASIKMASTKQITQEKEQHPYSEKDESKENVEEEDDPGYDPETGEKIPSRIERLVGFIASHFGDVTLLSAEDAKANVDTIATEMKESSLKPEDEQDEQDSKKVKRENFEESENQDNDQDDEEAPVIRVRVDDNIVDVSLGNLAVTGNNDNLRRRVESVVDLAIQIATPLSARATATTAWTKGRGNARSRQEVEDADEQS